MNLIQSAKDSISELLRQAARRAAQKGTLPSAEITGLVEIPKNNANGDFAANHAMNSARTLHMAPRKIAEALEKELSLEGTWFSKMEIAGPGFMNFTLGDLWYRDVLSTISKEKEEYGTVNIGQGKSVMVEFVSANPTGPMHLGNARGGVLGDALASVLEKAGYHVWREFYVNDAGNQIEKFAQSIRCRYIQLLRGEDAAVLPEDGYHGDDIRELARAFRNQYGDSYLDKPERECLDAMARFGLDTNIPQMQRDLEKYGIHYDEWFRESSLHSSGFVADTVQRLTDRGFTYEKDGALWLKTSEILRGIYKAKGKTDEQIEKLELKDDVLRRANGFYTYFAADIAYHRNKLETRKFDWAINIWGADHHGHVARLKAALDALGLDGENRLTVVLMQLVKLMRGGEVVRMSKRTGKMISLSNLLDEVPVDSARYFFNSKAESPVEFDLDLAVRNDGENPVYYVKYAHARICTMIENLKRDGYEVPSFEEIHPDVLRMPEERTLIKKLAEFPNEITAAAQALDPSYLNRYARELAGDFHKFYTDCRVKGAEEELLRARLYLSDAARQVLALALRMIGIEAPQKM
jgi:arginyl-tRNA synthetase